MEPVPRVKPIPGAEQYRGLRDAMVRDQIEARGVRDERILSVLREVPRHRFVAPEDAAASHSDRALPIGYDQTISQPYMVALQTELLHPRSHHQVLEVGTGSGYQAAVLSRLVARVHGVERIPELARRARTTLAELRLDNVRVTEGDGSLGLPDAAPFDGILVAAAAPEVPDSLRQQLRIGGRLVIPAGPPGRQVLLCIERESHDRFRTRQDVSCAFVPLIGKQGWPESDEGASRGPSSR